MSWICKQHLLLRGWGKTGLAHSFPTLTSVSINLVQKLDYLGGEKLDWSIIFPSWQVKVSTLPCHEYANNRCFLGGGEKLASPFFPQPDKIKQRLHVYSWQGKVGCVLRRRLTICTTVFSHPITFWTRFMFNLVRVGKEWAAPVFPHL